MKKGIILGSLMGVVLFSTTGCGAGGKQLNCTIEDESESAKVSQQTLVSFDSKENLSHVKITTITDANSDYADEMGIP